MSNFAVYSFSNSVLSVSMKPNVPNQCKIPDRRIHTQPTVKERIQWNRRLSTLSQYQDDKKKSGIIRRHLLFDLLHQKQKLRPVDVINSLLTQFHCKSIIIVRVPDLEHKEGDFHYRIGVHTTNASKHTYRKNLKEIFPFASPDDFQPRAIKGMRSWARQLIEKTNIIKCWGELKTQQLLELSQPAPRNAPKKVGRKPKGVVPPIVQLQRGRKKQGPKSYERRRIKNNGMTSYFWSLIKKINWIILIKILSLIIAICFYNLADFYIHVYKQVHMLQPQHFDVLSGSDLLRWFFDWHTPGLPKINNETTLVNQFHIALKYVYTMELSNLYKIARSFIINKFIN